jgi:SP family sugar porter-like MFS transporter
MRGRFVSINQLTIVIGILAAQIVNWAIARPVRRLQDLQATQEFICQSWNGQMGWRWKSREKSVDLTTESLLP